MSTTHRRPNNKVLTQARKAQLSYAIFRWESAATVAITLLLVVFLPDPFRGHLPFWQWWFWLVLGVVAEALIVVTSLKDPSVGERIVSETRRQELDPQKIASQDYRQKVIVAFEYQRQMELLVKHTRDRTLRAYLEESVHAFSQALRTLFDLALQLDQVQGDQSLRFDFDVARDEIARLEMARQDATEPEARAQIEKARDEKQTELARFERLESAVERVEMQLDQALDTVQAISASMQLLGAQDVYGDRARRLRQEVADLTSALRDALETLDRARRQCTEAVKSAPPLTSASPPAAPGNISSPQGG